MQFPILRTVLFAAVCGAATAAGAQTVVPPPLPPGSNLVRAEPGMNEDERKRYVRAHHHKFHHKKDYARDDSIHGHESEAVRTSTPAAGTGPMGLGAGAASRSGAGVQGGPGTGPKREQTDRGASSYFYGNEKK